jgi:hypothetical protein
MHRYIESANGKARDQCLNWIQFLSLGDGGNPMRRTRSRKPGDERMESISGAVRTNNRPPKCLLYAVSKAAMARGASLSSA